MTATPNPKRAPSEDDDGCIRGALRLIKHPLRALAMALAAFCWIADVAIGPGLYAGVIGALAGVFVGEILGISKLKTSAILVGLGMFALGCWLLQGAIGRFESLVALTGTATALRAVGLLEYGGAMLTFVAGTRALAVRKPGFLALELGFVVSAVASALAAHRQGVIARPLWLSDLAWRRGMDPTDLLFAIGIAAALLSIAILLFERRGRLSLAMLPVLPLIAMIGVSCLEVSGLRDEPPETMAEDPEDDDDGPDGTELPQIDSGSGESARGEDASLDGGAGGRGADGGDGAAGRGADAAPIDAAAYPDVGDAAGWSWDAGIGEGELPPPTESESGEAGDDRRPPDDLFDQPPPTGEQSAAPVAVVLFERDYSPPSGMYYFRQDAWSEFNGTRLVPTTRAAADRDIATRFPNGRLRVAPPPDSRHRVEVAGTVALMFSEYRPFALEWPVWLDEARNPSSERFRRAYRFFSRAQSAQYSALVGAPLGDPAWSEELRLLYLQPHPDPRFEEVARQIVGALPAPRQSDGFSRAVAIKLWLDENLVYSTRERHADADDPTVDFLFGNRIGYCVHFAHAAVYLWRAAGIPSRIGVGYAAPEADRRGGSALLINNGDAHAWPELYLEGVGWIVLDISAHENLDPPSPPHDEDLQRLLGEMAREEPPDPEDELDEGGEASSITLESIGISLLWLFLITLAVVLVVMYLIKAWRRIAPRLAANKAIDRVAFRLTLDRLAEIGMVRERGETREQFAERAAATAPSFERATTMILAARLGPPGVRFARADWLTLSAAIRREIKADTPWWRRLLGLLHPASFLDSR